MRETSVDSVGERRPCPLKRQPDSGHVSYKRFRRRIIQRGGRAAPVASTPLTTGGQCEAGFDFDTVRQRLELDSPPRHREPAQRVLQKNLPDTALTYGVWHHGAVEPQRGQHSISARKRPERENATEQGWVWRAANQEPDNAKQAGSTIGGHSLPFAVLDKAPGSLQGQSAMTLAAPSLLNDYYTNLLDCSCNGIIALALGSSVYLWNSETRALVGHLDPSLHRGRSNQQMQYITSLSWSRDGRALCIGTRRGEMELWDAEQEKSMRYLPSHLSVVRALAWKQQLLSSGCVLGRIHHFDLRAPAPLIGVAIQKEGICSLEWSPEEDCLASGSTDGHLHVWGRDIAGRTRSHQPITTMKQPSAVKAMGWCPWQRSTIATGGGWKDGALRIWDTQTETCVTSANTNSQICSLQWAEKKRYLVTGHGLPHHQVKMWDFPSLGLRYQLQGHSHRILHLALNPDNTKIFSAGADQCFHIWDL